MNDSIISRLLTAILGTILIIIAIIGVYQLIQYGKSIKSVAGTDYVTESSYFTPSFVGTYANGNFGNLPTGCSKDANGVLNCQNGTKIEFYVGISNNKSIERTFYADPCIIIGYKKGAECKEDNFLINNNNKGCKIQHGTTENCRTKVNFTLDQKTTYRVYSGARCSKEECPDTNNPNDIPTVNTNSYIDIIVS
jgi:hypothetical protein